jgi:hypothetical protein
MRREKAPADEARKGTATLRPRQRNGGMGWGPKPVFQQRLAPGVTALSTGPQLASQRARGVLEFWILIVLRGVKTEMALVTMEEQRQGVGCHEASL